MEEVKQVVGSIGKLVKEDFIDPIVHFIEHPVATTEDEFYSSFVELVLKPHPAPAPNRQVGGLDDVSDVAQVWNSTYRDVFSLVAGIAAIVRSEGKPEEHHAWSSLIIHFAEDLIKPVFNYLLKTKSIPKVLDSLVMLGMIHTGYTLVNCPPVYSCVSTTSGWNAYTNNDWQSRALPIKINFPKVNGKVLRVYRDVLYPQLPQSVKKSWNPDEGVSKEVMEEKKRYENQDYFAGNNEDRKKTYDDKHYHYYEPGKEADENAANLLLFTETIADRTKEEKDYYSTHTEMRHQDQAPQHTNVLFTWFAQWFVEMFFKTGRTWLPNLVDKQFPDTGRTWTSHNIDLSTVYGHTPERTAYLRSFKDGKLKTQTVGEEVFCPFYKSTGPGKNDEENAKNKRLDEDMKRKCAMITSVKWSDDFPEDPNNIVFLMGHPRQNLHPGTMAINTLFVRKHNLICDDLMRIDPKTGRHVHEDWLVKDIETGELHFNDETLFEKARVILTGMILKMVVEDYIQQINPQKDVFHFRFDPTLLKYFPNWQFHADPYLEFNLLYRWHFLAPEYFMDTPVPNTYFKGEWLINHGLNKVLKWAAGAPAHLMGFRSSPGFQLMTGLTQSTLRQSRELRIASFNEYRLRFGLPRYKSIEEMTGVESEKELKGTERGKCRPQDAADAVRNLYNNDKDYEGDGVEGKQKVEAQDEVDNVEFYVGLLTEKIEEGSIFGDTLTRMVLANAMKGIFSNPLCSPSAWRAQTFGGTDEFDWVNTMTLTQFIKDTTQIDNVKFTHPYTPESKSS